MAKGEDITTKFKVDISDLKKGITEANNQIKSINSEFKKATAGMDDWSSSADGLSAKIKQLKSTLEEQNKKLQNYQSQLKTAQKYEQEASSTVEELRKKLDEAKESYGENSDEVKSLQKELTSAEKAHTSLKQQVSNLTVTVNNQEATIAKTEKELSNFSTQLAQVQSEEAKANSKFGQLTSTIESQQKEVEELKEAYKMAVEQYGKNSDEAKSLAKEIKSLSSELADNKEEMQKLDDAANDLDKSLDSIDTADLNDGFTVLGGTLSNLVASAIKKVASAITDQLSSAISRVDTINNYSKVMQNLGFSAEESQSSMDKLSESINGLPTALDEIVSNTQQMALSLGDLEQATDVTIALNDALLSYGASSADVTNDITQLNQMISAGTYDLQSWTSINSTAPRIIRYTFKSNFR